jgi:hypothetical protein
MYLARREVARSSLGGTAFKVAYYDVSPAQGGLAPSEKLDKLTFKNVVADSVAAAKTWVMQQIKLALNKAATVPDGHLIEEASFGAAAATISSFNVYVTVYEGSHAQQIIETIHGKKLDDVLVLGVGTLAFCHKCQGRGHTKTQCPSQICVRLDSTRDLPFFPTWTTEIKKLTKASRVFSGNKPVNAKPKPWCIVEFTDLKHLMENVDALTDMWTVQGVLKRHPILSLNGVPESCDVCGQLATDDFANGNTPHSASDGTCPRLSLMRERKQNGVAHGQDYSNNDGLAPMQAVKEMTPPSSAASTPTRTTADQRRPANLVPNRPWPDTGSPDVPSATHCTPIGTHRDLALCNDSPPPAAPNTSKGSNSGRRPPMLINRRSPANRPGLLSSASTTGSPTGGAVRRQLSWNDSTLAAAEGVCRF